LDVDGLALTGTISTMIGRTSNMKHLVLRNNDLSGTVPSHIGPMSRLSTLNLDGNRNIQVIISEQMYRITTLRETGMGNMALTGSISSSIGMLSPSLEVLWLHSNSDIVGSIPDELFDNRQLRDLELRDMRLSGHPVVENR